MLKPVRKKCQPETVPKQTPMRMSLLLEENKALAPNAPDGPKDIIVPVDAKEPKDDVDMERSGNGLATTNDKPDDKSTEILLGMTPSR